MTTTGHLTPRSILRYRPLPASSVSAIPEIVPWVKRASRTITRPLAMPADLVLAGRHGNTVSRPSWSVTLGASMCLTLLFILLSQSLVTWTTTLYDNMVYGTPRTYQVDAFVGHEATSHRPSHFIALNDGGQIEVIEFPGDDATRAHVYLGPLLTGPHANQFPATLAFPDPHHTGHPDMLVQVAGNMLRFINRQGIFQPTTS